MEEETNSIWKDKSNDQLVIGRGDKLSSEMEQIEEKVWKKKEKRVHEK